MRARPAILAVILVTAGCSDAGDEPVAADTTDAEGTGGTNAGTAVLRPADEVRAEERIARYKFHDLGEAVDVDGILVTITGFTVESDEESGILRTTVHVENRTDETAYIPDISIECAGGPEAGGSLAGSTIGLNDELPAGSFDDGDLLLLLPADGRYGEPTPECVAPAVITAEATVTMDGAPVVAWEIPADVRVALNEATAAGGGIVPATTLAPTAATITVPADTAAPAISAEDGERGKDLVTAGQAISTLAASGIDCAFEFVPDDPNEIQLDPPIESDEYECTIGDQAVTLSFFESADARDGAFTALRMVFAPMFKAFGVETIALAWHDDGLWMVNVEPVEGSTASEPSPASMQLLEQIADSLDGDVHVIDL